MADSKEDVCIDEDDLFGREWTTSTHSTASFGGIRLCRSTIYLIKGREIHLIMDVRK